MRQNFGTLRSLIFRDMLTSTHWELTWCLEGTLASFASPDKPSDNKRDEGYHRCHIANPLSRVPLFWETLRTDKPSKNEFEPGIFHRFARKRVAILQDTVN